MRRTPLTVSRRAARPSPDPAGAPSRSLATQAGSVLSALVFAAALVLGWAALPAPEAHAAPIAVAQCNSVGGAGIGFECDVTVTNSVNLATGATSSVVTVRACRGAPNTTLVCAPVTTTNATDPVTAINQCNAQGNGGGGSLICRVSVTNIFTGNGSETPATVNQCNGSADGSGTNTCSPFPASTTNATVTQCNGSSNGGGSTVDCRVASGSMTSSALPVTVNQCNGSENGGGSITRCSTSLTNRFVAAGAVPVTPVTPVTPAPVTSVVPAPVVAVPRAVPSPVVTVAPVVRTPRVTAPAPAGAPRVGAPARTAAPARQPVVTRPAVQPRRQPSGPVIRTRTPPAIPSGFGGGSRDGLPGTAVLVLLVTMGATYALRRHPLAAR